jgi:hypothetical protein
VEFGSKTPLRWVREILFGELDAIRMAMATKKYRKFPK